MALILVFTLFSACQQPTVTPKPPVQTNGKMVKYITEEEVAARSTFEDCWMILDGKVYDVTEYIAKHPGEETILEGCGIDATILYENRPMGTGPSHTHSEQANAALEQYYIGKVGENTTEPAKEDPVSTAENQISYDPCELMTAEDLAAHFPGKTATITTHDTVANVVGQKICFYDLDPDNMIFAQLSFTGQSEMNPEMITAGQTAETLFAGTKEFAESATPVNGLGSEAYFGGTGLTPGAGLNVLSPDKQSFFTVTVGLGFGNADTDVHLQIEKVLAEKILSRI